MPYHLKFLFGASLAKLEETILWKEKYFEKKNVLCYVKLSQRSRKRCHLQFHPQKMKIYLVPRVFQVIHMHKFTFKNWEETNTFSSPFAQKPATTDLAAAVQSHVDKQ